MHPAMQRRRHRLMIRRTTGRHGRRQGLATVLVASAVVLVALVVGSVAGTGGAMLAAYNYFAADLPAPNILDDIQLPQSTLVYDRTGKTLLARFECQNRESVAFQDVPQPIVDATVAVEDRTFWSNSGIDFNATVAAFLQNLAAGQVVRGASTITQQVIKYAGSIKEAENAAASATPVASAEAEAQATAQSEADVCKPPELTFLNGRTYVDKIKENILALQVTAAYPGIAGKQKILETYLNLIFYGNGSYGIKAAAANYFGITDLSQLTVAQAAFLAGIPQLPSVYDPYLNPAGPGPAIARRNEVLARMLDNGYITRADYNTAVATTWEEMNPSRGVTSVLKEPQFDFRVAGEAQQILATLGYKNPAQEFRTGGFRVITTLDYGLQQQAKALVKKYVASFLRQGYDAHNGALVGVDSSTGEIIAYVGSVDYYNRTDPRVQGQFDVAGLGQRQIGSAFKPITYTSAFQARKATPGTMLVDTATDFGGGYTPQDADLSTRGPLLAMDALHYSLNIPSVKMQALVTPEVTARFAESIGLASSDYILGLHPGLTLTLGAVPVNLTKATQSYEMFANQGTIHPATTIMEIRDRNNRLIYSIDQNAPTPIKAVSPQVAYLTHWILEGNSNPRTNVWWGTRAELSNVYGRPTSGTRRHAGVKTGTTNDYKDVATFGYVPGSLVTGIWVGNSNGEPMTGPGEFLAAYGPLLMWHDFMDIALNKPWDWNNQAIAPLQDVPKPDGVTMTPICRWTGLAPSSACSENVTVPMLDGTQPGPDTSWVNGCLDLAKFARDQGRPATWQVANQAWADRQVNGDLRGGKTAASASPAPNTLFYRYGISTLPGVGHWPPVCGQKRATPTPSPTPQGSGGPSGSGFPLPSICHGNKCTPIPSVGATTAVSDSGTPSMPFAFFVIPAVAGVVPYLRRLRRRMRG